MTKTTSVIVVIMLPHDVSIVPYVCTYISPMVSYIIHTYYAPSYMMIYVLYYTYIYKSYIYTIIYIYIYMNYIVHIVHI